MNYLFLYVSTVFCGIFFLFRRRRVDFLFIYFVSLFGFALSVYFGVVYDHFGQKFIGAQFETGVVYGMAFLGLFIVGVLNDYGVVKSSPPKESMRTKGLSHVGQYLLMIIIFSLALAIFIKLIPVYMSATYKRQALEDVGFSLMLMSSLVVLGFSISVVYKSRAFFLAFITFLLILFFLGTRSPLVFSFFSYFLFKYGNDKVVIAKKIKGFLALLIFIVLIAVGKNFYGEVVYKDVDVSVWAQDYNVDKVLGGMEFLYTPSILDKAVENNFSIDVSTVLMSFCSLLPLPSSITGCNPSAFNDLFQPALFPGVEYGMAFNPWAEAYSWSGWVGVVIYSLFIPLLIAFVNFIFWRNKEKDWSALLLVLGVILSFWIHRNSLGSIFAYVRNAIYPFLGIYLSCLFVDSMFLRRLAIKKEGMT